MGQNLTVKFEGSSGQAEWMLLCSCLYIWAGVFVHWNSYCTNKSLKLQWTWLFVCSERTVTQSFSFNMSVCWKIEWDVAKEWKRSWMLMDSKMYRVSEANSGCEILHADNPYWNPIYPAGYMCLPVRYGAQAPLRQQLGLSDEFNCCWRLADI